MPLWTEYVGSRLAGLEPRPKRYDKQHVPNLACSIGVRVPARLDAVDDPERLTLAKYPDRFVLKPTSWWSARGVMPLVRQTDGRYRDLLRQNVLSDDEIIAEQTRFGGEWLVKTKQRAKKRYRLIVEEFVVGENGPNEIPFDYKLYTFIDRVRLVVQINRNVRPHQVAWFSDEFEPLQDGCVSSRWEIIERGIPVRPRCHEALVRVAKDACQALNTPFVSVDTYAAPDGAVLGEITPTPGGPYFGMWTFSPEFDADLGLEWENAARRLAQ